MIYLRYLILVFIFSILVIYINYNNNDKSIKENFTPPYQIQFSDYPLIKMIEKYKKKRGECKSESCKKKCDKNFIELLSKNNRKGSFCGLFAGDSPYREYDTCIDSKKKGGYNSYQQLAKYFGSLPQPLYKYCREMNDFYPYLNKKNNLIDVGNIDIQLEKINNSNNTDYKSYNKEPIKKYCKLQKKNMDKKKCKKNCNQNRCFRKEFCTNKCQTSKSSKIKGEHNILGCYFGADLDGNENKNICHGLIKTSKGEEIVRLRDECCKNSKKNCDIQGKYYQWCGIDY